MIEIQAQIQNGILNPNTREDFERLHDNFHANQIVNLKVTGPEKARSIPENNLFHACCKLVADNSDDKNWNTPEKVKTQCKIQLRFIRGLVVTGENVQFMLKSLKFSKSKQADSHDLYLTAWNHYRP